MNNKLETEKVGRLLFRLALPAITAQIVNLLYNIIDRMYIGHIDIIGSTALTGVGVAFPVILLISAFSALIGMGGAPIAAIKMGEKDNESAEKILGTAAATVVLFAVVLTALAYVFAGKLVMLFGASKDTLPYAMQYLNIYIGGTIFVMITMGLNPFISTQGFALVNMLTVCIGALLNICLDPVFIFLMNMGVRGAAIATVISQCVSAIWVVKFLTGKKTILKIKRENIRIDKNLLKAIIGLGISPFIMQITECALSACVNTSLQMYGGDIAVGSMTIMSSLRQMFFLPKMGLAQGAQPIVSYNYGAGNYSRVRRAFKLLVISAVIFSSVCFAVAEFAPQILVRMFTPDEKLIEYTCNACRIYFACVFMLGAQTACQQTFLALRQAKVSLFLAIVRKIVFLIPLIYIFPMIFSDKVFAVFLAEPVTDLLATTITIILFIVTFKKLIPKENIKIENIE